MKKTQINGKISCVHGLKELILLECPYYPKPSIDSMKFQPRFPHYFYKSRKNNPKICVEPQKTPSSQSNPEKEEQSWRHHTFWLQTILESCNNQNSMVLAIKTGL